MLTNKEAVEQLRNLKKENFYPSTIIALDMAIDALQQTAWIPVEERLPNGQENVIVTIYDDHGDTPWEYTTNAWHIDGVWIADNDIVCGSVLAWMPLPEPYKGGEDE